MLLNFRWCSEILSKKANESISQNVSTSSKNGYVTWDEVMHGLHLLPITASA